MLLRIVHETTYRYARPVELGPHRLMLRALEGHDVQIRSSKLVLEPEYRMRWIRDVFDNSIVIVDFLKPTDQCHVLSELVVEQYNTNPFDFILDNSAAEAPFNYADHELMETAPYRQTLFPDDIGAVREWMRPFLQLDGRAKTLDFLIAINKSFPFYFQYTRREEPGVQSPAQTLRQRNGSCRDFAVLLMEAARQMGLAARFVSGYLCHRTTDPNPDPASNATHAWAEIYLPGPGWKGFDPTSGILAASLHVRVAVARHPNQASPISGSFQGNARDYLGMDVRVDAHVT